MGIKNRVWDKRCCIGPSECEISEAPSPHMDELWAASIEKGGRD